MVAAIFKFVKVVGDKSTLQLAIERLYPDFDNKDIYISTGSKYTDLVKKQLPEIPQENIIGEPQMRDVGPAVGFVATVLAQKNPDEPMLILWSDHLVKKQDLFRKVVNVANQLIEKDPEKIVFIGQKPRFASQNLGWLEFGEKLGAKNGISFFQFLNCHYRPDLETAEKFFNDGHHAWNLGYFVTTPRFLLGLYKQFVPEMFVLLETIGKAYHLPKYQKVLAEIYPQLEKISFDNAILEKLEPEKGLVITEDLEWSDVGAWEALKEALQTSPEQNVISGKVLTTNCHDSLIYNYGTQMVAAIDLDGYLVVNTHDVVLVCKKDSVPKIKKLVESLSGTENEHLT